MSEYGPYPATVDRVRDGDTIVLVLDLGFAISLKMACRVFGINSPELNTEEGRNAQAFAQALTPVGSSVTVVSHGWDKYGGRFNGTITLEDGRDYASVMVSVGHAVAKVY